MKNLPTIRSRFFRYLLAVGGTSALIAVLGVGIADAISMHRFTVADLEHYARALSEVSATNITDSEELKRHLKDFSHQPGLVLSCIYDASNSLIAHWQFKSRAVTECPPLVDTTGTTANIFDVVIARAITKNDVYLGTVYLKGNLPLLEEMLVRTSITLIALFLLALIACVISAHYLSKRISDPLHSLKDFLKCLQHGKGGVCAIPSARATQETNELMQSIQNLCSNIERSMVSKKEVTVLRESNCQVMQAMVSLLRQRIAAESPLLPYLGDYIFLLQSPSDIATSKPVIFDLQDLAWQSLQAAKKLNPPGANTHISVSIKPDTHRYWLGHPELIGMLFRNLLLLALGRMTSGWIILRIDIAESPNEGKAILHYTLECGDDIVNIHMPPSLNAAGSDPLFVCSMLCKRLLLLLQQNEGSVDDQAVFISNNWLYPGSKEDKPSILPNPAVASPKEGNPPLVLVVEDDRTNLASQRALLESLGVMVFSTQYGEQAIEWALTIPFSAIILDTMLPDISGQTVAARIRHHIESNAIPNVPLWALTSMDTPQQRLEWAQAGVNTILTKPATVQNLQPLLKQLNYGMNRFYLQYDNKVQDEFGGNLQQQIPQLQSQLALQIRTLCDLMKRDGATASETAEMAHSVKSAALSLGYNRIASCMDALEHATNQSFTNLIPENRLFLSHVLGSAANQLASKLH